MDKRRDVSVFKSICWCIVLFALSIICGIVLSLIIGYFIGLLNDSISIVGAILSNGVVYFIFMSAITLDIGRRTASIFMSIFSSKIEKSRNIGKGFLGAGIILFICGIYYCYICIVYEMHFLDLTLLAIGLYYIITGMIADNEYKRLISEEGKDDKIPNDIETNRNTIDNSLDEYADYLCKNCEYVELPLDDALDFTKNVLRVGEHDKKRAISNMLAYKKKMIELADKDTYMENMMKVQFFLGVMNRNNIISEEEMEQFSESIADEFIDKASKLRSNKTK